MVTELSSTGDLVEYVALLEMSNKDTAETMEETDLVIIHKEDFDELINTNPEIIRKFV